MPLDANGNEVPGASQHHPSAPAKVVHTFSSIAKAFGGEVLHAVRALDKSEVVQFLEQELLKLAATEAESHGVSPLEVTALTTALQGLIAKLESKAEPAQSPATEAAPQ